VTQSGFSSGWATGGGGGFGGPLMMLVCVAILPENVSQEHQLCMKSVLITQSSGPVYQCGKYGLLVGWVVVRAGM
jgi:hypothetical protein